MIKSQGMRELIREECSKRCIEFDWDMYQAITDIIEQEISKAGTIMVEGEFSICPPSLVERVKRVVG